jgi:hypothetical protein
LSLTPLGTRAMRQRMLAEGREAGLVGELASASSAELLGTVAEHYTPETTAEEIAIWRAAHGGSMDPLVQAIRDCPFISRRVALLTTLVKAVPEEASCWPACCATRSSGRSFCSRAVPAAHRPERSPAASPPG